MFNHFLWVMPLCISILFFSLNGIHTLPDSAWYLSNGLNIYKGLGYVNPDLTPVLNRGPVFPVLIAGSFYLFGVKVESAFWVVRTFYILNALLIYFIGYKLYGKWVGFTASLLVLTSHIINIWSSYILLDNVMPFFILLYIFLLYYAFEKQSYFYFSCSGVVIGFAFLTKEMAVLYLPLPIFVFIVISQYRNRMSFLGLIIIFSVFVLVVGPWVYHINQYDRTSDMILGNDGSTALHLFLENIQDREQLDIIGFANQYLRSFAIFLDKHIRQVFILYPLIFLSYLFVITGSLKRKKEDTFLFLSMLVFVPVVMYIIKKDMRSGQNLILFFLTYIAVAHFLINGIPHICKKTFFFAKACSFQNTVKYMAIFGAAGAIFFQGVGDKNMWGLIRAKTIVGFRYFSKDKYPHSGWHNDEVQKVARWLVKNIQSDAKIMCDFFWFLSIYFYTDAKYRVYEIPYRVYPKELAPPRQAGIQKTDAVLTPLYLWPHLDKRDVNNYLIALCEDDLLQEIRSKKIDYVVVTGVRNFLSVYFTEHPGFIKIKDTGIIKVFKIANPQSIDSFSLRLGSNTSGFLQSLELHNIQKYNNIVDDFLKKQLGLTNDDIDNIKNGKGESVYIGKIY